MILRGAYRANDLQVNLEACIRRQEAVDLHQHNNRLGSQDLGDEEGST